MYVCMCMFVFVSKSQYLCLKLYVCVFQITGLLFFHKKSLYLPGATPLALWVETSCVSAVLDIQVDAGTDTVAMIICLNPYAAGILTIVISIFTLTLLVF